MKEKRKAHEHSSYNITTILKRVTPLQVKVQCLRVLDQFQTCLSYKSLSPVLKGPGIRFWNWGLFSSLLSVLLYKFNACCQTLHWHVDICTSSPFIILVTFPVVHSWFPLFLSAPFSRSGSSWFLVHEVLSPDASLVSSYSAHCREMHHTLIITANVRGCLAEGRHGLSRHIHTETCQPHCFKVIL